jgi:hypothetical protein
MRFKKGQSGNPRGRPKGKPDRRTAARELFEPHREHLIQKAIDLALEGDTTALRLCLERICPAIKATAAPIKITLPKGGDLADSGEAFLRAIATGRLPPDAGSSLLQALAAQSRLLELQELERRIEALERASQTQN